MVDDDVVGVFDGDCIDVGVVLRPVWAGTHAQVAHNDITYSMPHFVRYAVRDRESWAFYKERMTPRSIMPADEMERLCEGFDQRDMPLMIGVGGPYGALRGLMGLEGLSMAMHQEPELVHELVRWHLDRARRFRFPLIERLRPEIVQMGEDLCFNHGMLLLTNRI